jgi:dynamin 1-like protein
MLVFLTPLCDLLALKLAQEVDPAGNRTVGVLTKVDLMDDGTDCAEILLNQVIPLRRGYTAVINRSQKDIQGDVSIRDGLKKEDKFFKGHPVYARDRTLLTKCGTSRLATALNNMLIHHIRDVLPDLKHRIGRMMTDVQQEVDALGSPTQHASRSARGAALLSLLSKFATNFSCILEGKGSQDGKRTNRHPVNELMGGARISYIFTAVFAKALSTVGAFDGLTDEEIRTTICNANGTRPALFVPEVSFDILVRRQVARLEEPGVNCVDLVYEELQRIANQSEPSELTRFPVLRDRMMEVVMNLLRRCVNPTQMMVANLVKIELAYMNTSHPDFIGGSQAVAVMMQKIGKENDRRRAAGVAGVVGIPESTIMASSTPLSTSTNNFNGFEDAVENDTASAFDKRSTAGGGIMGMLFQKDNPSVSAVSHTPASVSRRKNRASIEPPSMVDLPQVPDRMNQADIPASEKEKIEMEIIKTLVASYFDIVRKNFTDMVPKTIMYFLVNHVRDSLQNELVSELYREGEVSTLLQEAEDIAARRQTCMEMKDLLSKALEIVNEVRDYHAPK